jgi:hypothetical protein
MKLINVKSSHIKAIGWEEKFKFDAKREPKDTLRIQFNDDSIYDYLEVSKRTFNYFLNARSKGTFFQNYIKNRYKTIPR